MYDRSMTREQYDALRRERYEACKRSVHESNSDGRSSYGSHSIRCYHAMREAEIARNSVPGDHSNNDVLDAFRRKRGYVMRLLRDRKFAVDLGLSGWEETYKIRTAIDPFYPEREMRERTARAFKIAGLEVQQ